MSSNHKNHIWGVQKYLMNRGIETIEEQWKIVLQYLFVKHIKDAPLGTNVIAIKDWDWKQACDFIQKDFTSFAKYILRLPKPKTLEKLIYKAKPKSYVSDGGMSN